MFKMKKMVLCLMAVALIGNAMAQKDYDVAMDIQYPLSFGFLAVCDQIFTAGSKQS